MGIKIACQKVRKIKSNAVRRFDVSNIIKKEDNVDVGAAKKSTNKFLFGIIIVVCFNTIYIDLSKYHKFTNVYFFLFVQNPAKIMKTVSTRMNPLSGITKVKIVKQIPLYILSYSHAAALVQ